MKSSFMKGIEFCYVGGKFETSKSREMQTICAIMKEIRAVTGMARYIEFFISFNIPYI